MWEEGVLGEASTASWLAELQGDTVDEEQGKNASCFVSLSCLGEPGTQVNMTRIVHEPWLQASVSFPIQGRQNQQSLTGALEASPELMAFL